MTYPKRPGTGHDKRDQPAQPRTSGRFTRRAWTMVLALAASMGFVFLNAGSASALSTGDVIRTDYLRNWETGRCLTAYRGITTQPCGGNLWAFQQWDIVYWQHQGSDWVWIRQSGTNSCLQWNDDISLGSCTAAETTWSAFGTSWDKVILGSLYHNGDILDSNYNGDVYPNSLNGGGYQMWKSGY